MMNECLLGEGLVRLIGAVVFGSCITRVQLYVNPVRHEKLQSGQKIFLLD